MTLNAGASTPSNRGTIVAAALLVALVFGGGGSPSPISELVVQLAMAGLALYSAAAFGKADEIPRIAVILAVLMLAVPVLQLVPLPPSAWQALPGRDLARDALVLIGAENEWRPWSLDPARTLASVLALLPPVWLLMEASRLPASARSIVPFVALFVAGLTLIVGAGQLSQGLGGPLRFYEPMSFYLDGFQANHNSTADILLIGLVAVGACVRIAAETGRIPGRSSVVLPVAAGACALIVLGIVLTGSRMGIALVPVALVGCIRIMRPWIPLSRRTMIIGIGAAAFAATVLALASTRSAALAQVIRRFDFSGEGRPGLWADALFAAQTYFPFGAGSGNFIPAMLAGERLENVGMTIPNRAHNELLELAVEGGAFSLAAWLCIVALVAVMAWRSRALSDPRERTLALFAETSLLVLALHSMVDYPFRSMALACLGAACTALLVPPARPYPDKPQRSGEGEGFA